MNGDQFSVARMCRQLSVSRTGYCQWRTRPPSARTQANAILDAQIAAIHARYKRRYGRPRILRELGQPVGHERVRKSLQRQGLRPLYRRPYLKGQHTTREEHMPSAHRKHMKWTPGRLLNWGQNIGAGTRAVVQWQLENRPHPEQGYRACLAMRRYSVKTTYN